MENEIDFLKETQEIEAREKDLKDDGEDIILSSKQLKSLSAHEKYVIALFQNSNAGMATAKQIKKAKTKSIKARKKAEKQLQKITPDNIFEIFSEKEVDKKLSKNTKYIEAKNKILANSKDYNDFLNAQKTQLNFTEVKKLKSFAVSNIEISAEEITDLLFRYNGSSICRYIFLACKNVPGINIKMMQHMIINKITSLQSYELDVLILFMLHIPGADLDLLAKTFIEHSGNLRFIIELSRRPEGIQFKGIEELAKTQTHFLQYMMSMACV